MILTKRQKQILDYVQDSIRKNGYAPSLTEISRHFDLHSISTVHKHLVHLEEKGLIKRHWNRARAIEVVPVESKSEARDVPLVGLIAAGSSHRGGSRERGHLGTRRHDRATRRLRSESEGRVDGGRAGA